MHVKSSSHENVKPFNIDENFISIKLHIKVNLLFLFLFLFVFTENSLGFHMRVQKLVLAKSIYWTKTFELSI